MLTLESPTLAPSDPNTAALRAGRELFAKQPDWRVYFREIFGVDGTLAQLFPDAADRARFEKTEACRLLQSHLSVLRGRKHQAIDPATAQRMITVRLPAPLHESLKTEATRAKTSLNQLCITKLLQPVDPSESANL